MAVSPGWRCRDRLLVFDRTLVMGVVNVTPDSFSDGGRFFDPAAAVAHGRALAAAGADILDVGGESSRPGSEPVAPAEECVRVCDVVAALAADGHVVSIDTRHGETARAALAAGAVIVNDIAAGRGDPQHPDAVGAGTIAAAADAGAGLVLMHMQGDPATMQRDPRYVDDVVGEVAAFLRARCDVAHDAGVAPEAVMVDPGIGFGKTLAHNLALLAGIDRIGAACGAPVLVGTSRKSMFAALLGLDVSERLEASLATAVWSALLGAAVIRAHDVAETVAAVRVVDAARAGGAPPPV